MGISDCHPILFTYDISVFGRRVDWYLTLRKFNYSQCHQPNRLPRPDLTDKLGISYRRIPILAIGRDIYCDSQLIIEKLEKLFPGGTLGSTNPYERGLEAILQQWIIHGGPFWQTASLIPPDTGIMLDDEWTQDRQEMTGKPFSRETMARARPDGLVQMRNNFDIFEHGLLADGRDFILGTEQPTLADIHTVWPFDWAIGESMRMGEHLDPIVISEECFPKVYAWARRFRGAVESVRTSVAAPCDSPWSSTSTSPSSSQPVSPSSSAYSTSSLLPDSSIEVDEKDQAQKQIKSTAATPVISGEEAIRRILESDFWEKEQMVEELDPMKLKRGQMVTVYPTDTGSNHKDVGRLVSLCRREVVIESKVRDDDGYLRLHFPRHNFRVEPSEG